MVAPEGVEFDVPDANHITVRGIDKEIVGEVANFVRAKRPPEVYRGKGIKYATEHIRRKEGKAGKNKNFNYKLRLAVLNCIKIFSMYQSYNFKNFYLFA